MNRHEEENLPIAKSDGRKYFLKYRVRGIEGKQWKVNHRNENMGAYKEIYRIRARILYAKCTSNTFRVA